MSLEDVFKQLDANRTDIKTSTVDLLVKVADNILQDPKNLKVRTLKKTNAIVKGKILSVSGGIECLKLMGFQENETSYILPSNIPLDKIKRIKDTLLQGPGVIPKRIKVIRDIPEEIDDDIEVERFVPPPLVSSYTNGFLRKIETYFNNALAFNHVKTHKHALTLVPLTELEEKAQKGLRSIQEKIKKEHLKDPDYSIQDILLLELLAWFKNDFFSWVDTPDCGKCGGNTSMSHLSTDKDDLLYTNRVEVHKCSVCGEFTQFPRYNDLNILLETRRGRCGEWAQVFTMICRALGWDARFVVDELDHVWTEVYSITQKRWIHCDPCENACDTPLMYENGWNKKITYVMAYSGDDLQDVTWRYSSKHKEVLARRKNCSEHQLIDAIVKLRHERQKNFTETKRNYLNRRIINELLEMMVERQPNDDENQGRISGSAAWRSSRGENDTNDDITSYIWKIDSHHIRNDTLTIRYSTAFDRYEYVLGDGFVRKVENWRSGVFSCDNIFRKEEKDWKTVYLARNEGTEGGAISWKFELTQSDKVIDTIEVNFSHKTYENGSLEAQIKSGDFMEIINGEKMETSKFSGVKNVEISARLTGGKGSVAWQHSQLFRQSSDGQEFPFSIHFTFKNLL